MKRITQYLLLATISVSVSMASCKGKKTEAPQTQTTNADSSTSSAPQISSDDDLSKGVTDATKDYPGVTASVDNGEVTLTGSIKRDRLSNLMQSIQSLHPKKVNNNLTVQD